VPPREGEARQMGSSAGGRLMSAPRPDGLEGITVDNQGDRVVIEVEGGHWEGDPVAAERLLTGLHYALGRARPGTNIVSMFVDGKLWGGKTVQTDPARAMDDVRTLVEQLSRHTAKLAEQPRRRPDDVS
jgi:hypothetical protein